MTHTTEMEIIMKNDKLVIGGHEFNSRFILGSGKYSMKLIEAAVKDAGAEIIHACSASCQYERAGKYFGLHSGRDNAIAEYQWRQNG